MVAEVAKELQSERECVLVTTREAGDLARVEVVIRVSVVLVLLQVQQRLSTGKGPTSVSRRCWMSAAVCFGTASDGVPNTPQSVVGSSH